MNDNERKKVRFSCSKILSNKDIDDSYGTIIKIDFCSKMEIDVDDCLLLHDNLKKYTDNLSSNSNIIDIVNAIRDITDGLSEGKLDVSIGKENSGEYVYYKNGMIDSCGAYKGIYGDEVVVFNNRDGVDIKFKKSGFNLDGEQKLLLINEELNDLYQVVINLFKMQKTNDMAKVKRKML